MLSHPAKRLPAGNESPLETAIAPPARRAGIIGAGQLALMLAEAADALGLQVAILARDAADPAARHPGATVMLGSAEDPEALARFLHSVDCVAFEQELRDGTGLAEAARRLGRLPAHAPSIDAMLLCSDKLAQKDRLKERGLPTAPWLQLAAGETPDAFVMRVVAAYPQGSVLKLARGGYDGRGNLFLAATPDADARAEAAAFCERGARESAVYAEPRLPFAAELAVVSTRWATGDVRAQLPAVVTRQEGGICVDVAGPASALGIDPRKAAAAEAIAAEIGAAVGLTGTYAVEFFLLRDGELVVNEIAPRVHNSGHFSQDAAGCSQFESHWRAILAMPPGPRSHASFFGMLNVLGGTEALAPFATSYAGAVSHWYGKTPRPGRKVGHVNVTADSPEELREKMARIAAMIAAWRRRDQ